MRLFFPFCSQLPTRPLAEAKNAISPRHSVCTHCVNSTPTHPTLPRLVIKALQPRSVNADCRTAYEATLPSPQHTASSSNTLLPFTLLAKPPTPTTPTLPPTSRPTRTPHPSQTFRYTSSECHASPPIVTGKVHADGFVGGSGRNHRAGKSEILHPESKTLKPTPCTRNPLTINHAHKHPRRGKFKHSVFSTLNPVTEILDPP
jgi:hypothetical protein